MNMLDMLIRKRDGLPLQREDLESFISNVCEHRIPDYQIAAWLMAVMCRGLTGQETIALTAAMAASGEQLHIREMVAGPVLDKHSTGGVGDKVTIAVVPIVAACGFHIAKMSGRGLGFAGGTIDKLEAIPGFHTEIAPQLFIHQVQTHGIAIAAQSANLAPADGILYALRDVTATVPSLPLIASSIMSKKLAVGASHLMLDVKVGAGAFMKSIVDAQELAEVMVAIGTMNGIDTHAIISSMEQPLGRAVGNALEVVEAIEILQGKGPPDVTFLCIHEAAALLHLAGTGKNDALAQVHTAINSGSALEKLTELISIQGGNPNIVERPSELMQAPVKLPVYAPRRGIVRAVNTERIGAAAQALGAGRLHKGDTIDPVVGLIIVARVGDDVNTKDVIAHVHARSSTDAEDTAQIIQGAFDLAETGTPVYLPPLILGEVGE
jgi:pyrimidine-nucleoside phosphorylase